MFQPVAKPHIAVLGLSLDLYSRVLPGYMDKLKAQLGRFQAQFAEEVTIVASQLCHQQQHVAKAIRQAEAERVDAVLLLPLSYTASGMTLTPITQTNLPVVIWSTQEALRITEAYTADDLLMNHTAQGTQDLTNTLRRSRRVFGMVSGHYKDRKALRELIEWLQAARAFQFSRRMRVGLLGQPFQDMRDCAVDNDAMAAGWGPQTINVAIPRFVELLEQADQDEIEKMMAEDRRRFDIAPEITDEIHRQSAMQAWALHRLVEEHQLDAFTMNFLDLIENGRCGTLPFFGINKLMAEGLGYAGEGDVLTAAHMAQMRQLCGQATFTEIYTIDYVDNRMMMSHMQECNPAMARTGGKVQLVKMCFWAKGCAPYVGMHFTLAPGEVTITSISPDGKGNFEYTACETRIRDMAPLQQFTQPHWMVELDEPAGDFLTRYSLAGGPHHLVAVAGNRADALRKLATFQGFGYTRL